MNQEQTSLNTERIRWACRRGMLELDLFLVPFFENCYADLTSEEKKTFQQLLTHHDPDLHQYLTTEQKPDNKNEAALVDKIRTFRTLHSQRSCF